MLPSPVAAYQSYSIKDVLHKQIYINHSTPVFSISRRSDILYPFTMALRIEYTILKSKISLTGVVCFVPLDFLILQ
jgi:hypothetical protein